MVGRRIAQRATARGDSGAARTSLLRADGLSAADLAAWRRLADRASEPNPYFRPEFVLARTGPEGRGVRLVVVRSGAEWIACLAVRRRARDPLLPLPCLGPWSPDYAFDATPLVDPAAAEPAAAALVSFLRRQRAAAALVLAPFDPDGVGGAALVRALERGGLAPVVVADFERAALRRRTENSYLSEAMSSRGRSRLRAKAKALGEALDGELRVVDRSDDPRAWDEFLALEAAGWKGREGTALASRDEDAAFFRRMCAAMSAEGRLLILAYEGGGRTIAMQCRLFDGHVMSAFKVAYDEAFARFSPGALLGIEALEVFHRRPATTFADSCAAPDHELMNRMWPDRRHLQVLLIPTGAPHARLIGSSRHALAVARDARERWQAGRGRLPWRQAERADREALAKR